MRQVIETMSALAMMGAAVTMLVLYMGDVRASRAGTPGVVVSNWEEYNEAGVRLGPDDAAVVVTEFMDFTCPHCRNLAPVTDSLREAFPDDVAVVFQYFPLNGRVFSMELAIAAECASEQGKFDEMRRAIFVDPQIRSREALLSAASSAAIKDMKAFGECLARPSDTFERIRAGRQIGEQAGVRGTPTVWMNGEPTTARTFDALLAVAEEHGLKPR